MVTFSVSLQGNICQPLTEQLILLYVEIYRNFFVFKENTFPCPVAFIALSTTDWGFLPNILFEVFWNVDILIMPLYSLPVTVALTSV